jgi:hypothetical protein
MFYKTHYYCSQSLALANLLYKKKKVLKLLVIIFRFFWKENKGFHGILKVMNLIFWKKLIFWKLWPFELQSEMLIIRFFKKTMPICIKPWVYNNSFKKQFYSNTLFVIKQKLDMIYNKRKTWYYIYLSKHLYEYILQKWKKTLSNSLMV